MAEYAYVFYSTAAKAQAEIDAADTVTVDEVQSGITIDGGTLTLGASVEVSNWPVTQQVAGTVAVSNPGLTDAQLRASAVPVSGTVAVSNHPPSDYATEAHAADQTGADAVLTFTVTAGDAVIVDVDPVTASDTDNYRARATTDGSTPSATSGFVCRPGSTVLPIICSGTVKVYAPTGVTVSVQSLAR